MVETFDPTALFDPNSAPIEIQHASQIANKPV
jgi:hypothetical protein